MEERFTDLTTNSTIRQPIGVDEDAVVISSDEEEDSLDDEPLVDEISREISNLDLCQSGNFLLLLIATSF